MTGSLVPDRFPTAAGTSPPASGSRFPLPKGTGNRSAGFLERFLTHRFPPKKEPVDGNHSPRHIADCLAEVVAELGGPPMTTVGATSNGPGRCSLSLGRPPAVPLSTNEERSIGHWRTRERLMPWKLAAWAAARNARLDLIVENDPCYVTLEIPFTTERRRDPSNYIGTIVKAVVDGLVQAKTWPDDTPDYVTIREPILIVDPTGRALAAVHLEARP